MSLTQTSPWESSLTSWLRNRPMWWPSGWDDLAVASEIRGEEFEDDDTFTHRAEGQLQVPRYAQLPHDEHIEWRMESLCHFVRHRHSAPWKPGYECVLA